MDEKNAGSSKKRGIAAGLGLTAASLLATQSADAAQQFADLAASDNRFGTIALLALPVLGWGERELGGLCAACWHPPPPLHARAALPPLTLCPPVSRAFRSGLQHGR